MSFKVSSSVGCLTVNSGTGKVLSCNAKHYHTIVKFDIIEWMNFSDTEEIDGRDIDILDMGYWCKDGTHISPVEGWREERKALRKGEL